MKLQQKIYFTMKRLKQLFEATEEYELVVYTPHITTIRSCEGAEATFSKDGRILIKKVLNKMKPRQLQRYTTNSLGGFNKMKASHKNVRAQTFYCEGSCEKT